MTMRSDKDDVFGNLIEENTEVKILDNGKETGCELYGSISEERVKENAGNMSGHHSYEFKIGPNNERIQENRNSLEDHLVFYVDKNVMARKLPETVIVSNYEEVTFNIVKDVCVDEGVPVMPNEKPFGSKSSDDSKLNQEIVNVTEQVKDDCKVAPGDVVAATTRIVSKEALTLGDIISMEGSQKLSNKNNTHGPEETEQKKTEEPIAGSLRYLSTEMEESENQRLNDVFEDSSDHNLFSSNFPNGSGERSFSEAEPGLAHISYSGLISVSGNISVRSDGSTVSGSSFAFPLLQSEWNSSPVRMVKAEKIKPRKEKGWRHYSLLLCCRF
ncbi:PREDICTED: uncharacterized protein LOC104755651 [Camelina sativa]|uniref:Uncharacterized protein LOC104755651 n=1 Tax=Camelina sativa TaxID=90675 RepID=A0ABM1R7N2_CAMSA|nr:PREDICTED: uncharacterized protein LOC104755651 [Camelina sativa]XP_010476373.1 PREDICTED: uncharacterized protein LOC104755651 [Camelina sativa]XP_019095020.1 PREDICTED: uncharacterized protein LOC104755651 [Camelina sativa]